MLTGTEYTGTEYTGTMCLPMRKSYRNFGRLRRAWALVSTFSCSSSGGRFLSRCSDYTWLYLDQSANYISTLRII